MTIKKAYAQNSKRRTTHSPLINDIPSQSSSLGSKIGSAFVFALGGGIVYAAGGWVDSGTVRTEPVAMLLYLAGLVLCIIAYIQFTLASILFGQKMDNIERATIATAIRADKTSRATSELNSNFVEVYQEDAESAL